MKRTGRRTTNFWIGALLGFLGSMGLGEEVVNAAEGHESTTREPRPAEPTTETTSPPAVDDHLKRFLAHRRRILRR